MTYELVNVKDDSVVAEGKLKISEFVDNDYKEISFPEVKNSKENQYRLTIRGDGVDTGRRNQYFYHKKENSAKSLKINGTEQNQALVLKVLAKEFNIRGFYCFDWSTVICSWIC